MQFGTLRLGRMTRRAVIAVAAISLLGALAAGVAAAKTATFVARGSVEQA